MPYDLDPHTRAWQIPYPIVQSDGTIQIMKPSFVHDSYDNLKATMRDDGIIETVIDLDMKESSSASIALDRELTANFNKFNFINLTSCYFHWWDWWSQGSIKIYNVGEDKKKIELYLGSIDEFYKKIFVEYEFIDNRIIILTYNCKRFLLLRFAEIIGISCLLTLIGFLLILYDTILMRFVKRVLAKRVR